MQNQFSVLQKNRPGAQSINGKTMSVDVTSTEDSPDGNDNIATVLNSVEIDALVVLKIIKHCRESLPSLVTGQLLGMDVGSQLEVTHCFPFPTRVASGTNVPDEEGGKESNSALDDIDGAAYQMEMMRCLRLVNVDHNTVGWYQSTYLGSFVNQSMIETQFSYQENIPKSVLFVYDPLKSSQGNLALRCLRLSDQFMQTYREKKFLISILNERDLSFENIFDELQLSIRNAHLVNAFLLETPNLTRNSFTQLDVSQDPFVERHLQFMMDGVDAVANEQAKSQLYQRSLMKQRQQQKIYVQKCRIENATRLSHGQEPVSALEEEELRRSNPIFRPIPEPNQLEGILVNHQMNIYCSQLSTFGLTSMTNLYLDNELRQ